MNFVKFHLDLIMNEIIRSIEPLGKIAHSLKCHDGIRYLEL